MEIISTLQSYDFFFMPWLLFYAKVYINEVLGKKKLTASSRGSELKKLIMIINRFLYGRLLRGLMILWYIAIADDGNVDSAQSALADVVL